MDVPGEDAADVILRHQVEQGGLVIDVIVAGADREVLEQQHRGVLGQAAEDPLEPAQAAPAVVAGLLQGLGRVKPGEVHAARAERRRRSAEIRVIALLGGCVPPHVVISWHVPDPVGEAGGNHLAV